MRTSKSRKRRSFDESVDSSKASEKFRPLSFISERLVLIGANFVQNKYSCTDHPEASKVVDACIVIKEVIE